MGHWRLVIRSADRWKSFFRLAKALSVRRGVLWRACGSANLAHDRTLQGRSEFRQTAVALGAYNIRGVMRGRALRKSWGQSPAGRCLSLEGGAELVYRAYRKGASRGAPASAYVARALRCRSSHPAIGERRPAHRARGSGGRLGSGPFLLAKNLAEVPPHGRVTMAAARLFMRRGREWRGHG
jgi:hypothetical protein